MKLLNKLLGATLGMLLTTGVSYGADHKLTISSWAPPGHGLNAQMWPNLIKMMEEATGGKVTAEVKYGLAHPPAQMDLVLMVQWT